MARLLLVGNSCRAREFAREFAAAGNAVRVTTRSEQGVRQISAVGAEGVVCDPARLSTLLPFMQGVTVIFWLLGNAQGNAADLHGPRLVSVLEKTVDSGVRGFAYEAAGNVAPDLLAGGVSAVGDASSRWHIPTAIVTQHPAQTQAWLAGARAAFDEIVNS